MFKSNIYVRYIPKDVTKEELEAEFSKAGQICSTKIKEFKIKSDLDDKPAYQIAYVLYSEVKDA
jgi:RNA recognition motif-containing protein